MAHKLGVVVLHGIGEQKADFADGMIAELRQRLGRHAAEVCFKPIWWASLVEPKETDLLAKLDGPGRLDWMDVRRIVFHFLADAVAYQRVPGESDTAGLYVQIHALITRCLTELRGELTSPTADPNQEPPLVVLAHSLGGHIMSNYLWDQQHPREERGRSSLAPFVRGETLAGIVTFGCNIPLFALALPAIEPIAFPPRTLAPQLQAAAKWLNFYDRDDVLGYPLQPLSSAYERLVRDIPVNSGNLLTSWNPFSHGGYWTDDDVTKPVAGLLLELLSKLA